MENTAVTAAPETAAPASAPAAAPAPTSATEAAISTQDVRAYREARAAERVGKPKEFTPPAAADASTDEPDANTPASETEPQTPEAKAKAAGWKSQKAAKEQERINNYERQLYEQRVRMEQLERMVGQGIRPQAPEAPRAPAAPDWKAVAQQFASHPNAPQLEQFDSLPEYQAAMSYFVNANMMAAQQQQQALAQRQQVAQSTQETLVTGFLGRLEEAKKADPKFMESLSDEVKAIKPLHALQPGERPTALHVVGTQIFESPAATKLMQHFSQHPEDLRSLVTPPAHLAQLPRELMIPRHEAWIARQIGALEAKYATPQAAAKSETPTAIPPPPQTVGRRPGGGNDPMEAAIKQGDMASYKALRQQQKLAAMVKR